MKYFMISIVWLLFSLQTGHACLKYTPDEETEKFRDKVKSPEVFRESRESIQEIESNFKGFRLIADHIHCQDCAINKVLKCCGSEATLDLRFCFLKNRVSKFCWYQSIPNNCANYAYLTAIYEEWPNKDEAIAILSCCMGIPCKVFDFIELVETKDPEEATIVQYSTLHTAYYRGQGIVESKWGTLGAVFRHKIFQVPRSYGDAVRFYKMIFKKLPPHFVKDNWPNPTWKLLGNRTL